MQETQRQWSGSDTHGWSPVGNTTPSLPPGIYVVQEGGMMSPPTLLRINPLSDKPLIVDDGLSATLIKGVQAFLAARDRYLAFSLLQKRGLLLEGEPGTGKTIACQITAAEVTALGGYTLFVSPNQDLYWVKWGLHAIAAAYPDAPKCVIYEDIDQHSGEMHNLLSLLDGENQIANVINIATTNYIDKLDKRLVNRPSRFDEIIHVGPPSLTARTSYITQLIPPHLRATAPISRLASSSDGLMLAHLRELVVATQVLNLPIDSAIARLKGMNTPPPVAPDAEMETVAIVGTRRRKSPTPISQGNA